MMPSRASASRQSTSRAATAPCVERDRRDVAGFVLVGLREVGGVRVDLHALAGQPGDGAAGVEAAGERDAEPGALRAEASGRCGS